MGTESISQGEIDQEGLPMHGGLHEGDLPVIQVPMFMEATDEAQRLCLANPLPDPLVEELMERIPLLQVEPDDPNIAPTAPATLHHVTPLRGKPGGKDVVDLGGGAGEVGSQHCPLNLNHLGALQVLLQVLFNIIGQIGHG